jgi:hypothetical protein
VIQKYNRHWAMVMHPEDAVAGSDLMQVARKSVLDVIPGDEDAKAGGGAFFCLGCRILILQPRQKKENSANAM